MQAAMMSVSRERSGFWLRICKSVMPLPMSTTPRYVAGESSTLIIASGGSERQRARRGRGRDGRPTCSLLCRHDAEIGTLQRCVCNVRLG